MNTEQPGLSLVTAHTTATEPQIRPAGGVYIGVHDMLPGRPGMRRHTIAATERRHEYLEPPGGPGGHWAYALCEVAAYYYEDATSYVKALPECPDCVAARDV